MPALFQFDPALVCFEEAGEELVFTADLDIPLVRYNLHDRGKVIPYQEMIRFVKELRIQNIDGWEYPFLVVSGRSDVAVVIYGAKIYPEQLQKAMQDTRIRDWLSGSFLAWSVESESGQLFCLDCELSDSARVEEPQLSATLASVIQERLIEVSSEYRNSCSKLGKLRNQPNMRLYRKGDDRFPELRQSPGLKGGFGKTASAFLWQAGRKPKVVVLNESTES
jgi:phenylacetate-coenzyme A ligase PaaK-like adenylate-forming protein